MSTVPLPTTPKPTALRLRIEYADHNESFSGQLPRIGTIEEEIRFLDSANLWYLVRLEAPVTVEGKSYSRLLLASRWIDCPIDTEERASAFILLVPEGSAPNESHSYKEFTNIAWGMVSNAA